MARKLKNFENETHTPFNLEYGGKHSKTWKMRNAHCRTWSMVRKLKTQEMRHTDCRTWNMARKLTNEENEKLTWQDLESCEKH